MTENRSKIGLVMRICGGCLLVTAAMLAALCGEGVDGIEGRWSAGDYIFWAIVCGLVGVALMLPEKDSGEKADESVKYNAPLDGDSLK